MLWRAAAAEWALPAAVPPVARPPKGQQCAVATKNPSSARAISGAAMLVPDSRVILPVSKPETRRPRQHCPGITLGHRRRVTRFDRTHQIARTFRRIRRRAQPVGCPDHKTPGPDKKRLAG